MENIKLLVDENFPVPAITHLRAAGVTVVAVSEISPGVNDEAVLRLAIEHGAWLASFDLDFGELIFQNKSATPNAVIVFRENSFRPVDLSRALQQMIGQAVTYNDKFVIWTSERIRVRPLPKYSE
jgi:predicted nuclease of predicted toxin-antitoxin system